MGNQLSAAETRLGHQYETYNEFCDRLGITKPATRQKADYIDGVSVDKRQKRINKRRLRIEQ
jgi:hypothetical protein